MSVSLLALAGLALSACSAGSDPAAEASASTSPSPSSTVSVPAGVSLTEQGSDLAFGAPATVVFEPDQTRGTVLELSVRRAVGGTVKDFSGFVLDDNTRKATPYYVDVAVRNVGEGAVGAAPVPLWGVDARNTLLPAASFTTSFPKCPSKRLPKQFAAGASFSTCLVFLAPDHGTLTAVSFRPSQEFDPIRWTGPIATQKARPDKPAHKAKKAAKKPGHKTGHRAGHPVGHKARRNR